MKKLVLPFFGLVSMLIMSLFATNAFFSAFASEDQIHVIRINQYGEANLELYLFMFFWFSIGYFLRDFVSMAKKYYSRKKDKDRQDLVEYDL